MTPLHMAAKGGHMQLVEYLVDDRGAKISKDDRGVKNLYMNLYCSLNYPHS